MIAKQSTSGQSDCGCWFMDFSFAERGGASPAPSPCVDLRFQDLRQPTALGQATFGGGHKLALLQLTKVLKIRLVGPLSYCRLDLIFF
jgi:hypothetical protein